MAVEKKSGEPSPESRSSVKFSIRIFLKIKKEPVWSFDYLFPGTLCINQVIATKPGKRQQLLITKSSHNG
jgi:hypothetical protein